MMTFQSSKSNRSKDPFSVQPLPKSFYHPSPTKEVNEREAIRSPQRRSNPTTTCAEVEEFLKRSPTFHSSALPNIRTLYGLEKTRSDLPKQGDVIDSSELDETWPDSDRPNSVSATSVPEDTEAESPDVNIGDVMRGLEKQKRLGSSVDVMDCKTSGKTPIEDTGESVLRRYVERFRNSAPKSREERMKEKSDKLPFWWLQSSSDKGTDSMGADGSKGDNLKLNHCEPEARPESQRLTKEALLAMDEETFHLQSKADRLLSRSELSLASSSPIVSTEGLGSSASVSNSSVIDDQKSYRPAFIRIQESYNRPASKPVARTEDKSRLLHAASRSPADDILTRWRLQRKVEEASAAVSGGHRGKMSSVKPSRNTDLDVRLEEFRKKILSQKALVTQQDILYERQRLSVLMEDVRQDENALNKDTAQPQSVVQVEEPTKDIILEKLQRITRSQDYRPAVTETFTRDQERTTSSFAVSTGDRNFSINNANFVHTECGKSVEHSLADPTLNRNNTASSDQQVLQDMNINSSCEPPVVDSFGSQVVFDPKKKQFLLKNSGTESHYSRSESLKDDSVREVSNEKKKIDVEEFHQKQAPVTGNFQSGERNMRNVKNDSKSRSNKTDCSEESQRGAGDMLQSVSESNISSDDVSCVEEEQKQVKGMSGSFYQYLEAEKPISESRRLNVSKGNKTEKVIMNDNTDFDKEEKLEQKEKKQKNLTSEKIVKCAKQVDEEEEDVEDRGYNRKQKKTKCRHKNQIRKETNMRSLDTGERDVLVDITNERNDLVNEGSYSEMSGVKGHPGSVTSYGNKDVNVYLGKLGKKSRPVTASTASPGKHAVGQRSSSLAHQPVQHAIGQAIADHLFEGSTLASSVDSWASAFPQSPGLSRSINGSGYSTISPAPSPRDNTPLESTPRLQVSSDQQAGSDEEYTSDGEFHDDPLLEILRQQRDHFLQQLMYIEKKLQALET